MRKYLFLLINILIVTSFFSCQNNINNKNIYKINKSEMTTMEYFNFENSINDGDTILTKYNNKELIIINLTLYEGPLTMQYLPYGGIQSVYNNNLIIHFVNGYYKPSRITYDGKNMSVKEFIKNNPDLVNTILG